MKLSTTARGRIVSLLVVAGVIALEFTLSALGYGNDILMEGSARHSVRLLPSQVVTLPSSQVPMAINSQGFRGPEWEPPPRDAAGRPRRDPGLLRVAVLGHSVTLGGWETEEESFCGVAEAALAAELLRAGDARRAQVMNFGGPAHNLELAARTFEDFARPYRPDYLVVPFFAVDVQPAGPLRPPRDFPLRGWIVRTALYDWIRELAGERGRILSGRLTPEEEQEDRRVQEIAQLVQFDPFDARWDELWSGAFERLEELRAEQAADGGRTLVVGMVELRDLHPPPGWKPMGPLLAAWCEGRDAVLHADPLESFRQATAPLRQEMLASGVPARRVWSVQRPSPPPWPLEHLALSPFLLSSPAHYTPLGHKLVGEAIAAALIADLRRENAGR